MPAARFTPPNGEPLHIDINGDDDTLASHLVLITANMPGTWLYADALSDPAHAVFIPIGTVIDVQFDSALVPDPIRTIGVALGDRG